MKIKKFLLPIWWYNRDLFPRSNKYVVFVLNGLILIKDTNSMWDHAAQNFLMETLLNSAFKEKINKR